MKKYSILFMFIPILSGFKLNKPGIVPIGRVIGGIDAEENIWKFMIALGINKHPNFAFYCGASVIDACHILTAAHCL